MDTTNYTFVILLGLMVSTALTIIIRIIKSERKRKAFSTTMKIGDSVYSPILNDKVEGDVLEVNDDTVVIKVTVPKSRVYPRK